MQFVNLTPHEVRVIMESGNAAVFPPSDAPLRLINQPEKGREVFKLGDGEKDIICVVRKGDGLPNYLPHESPNVQYIVSAVVAAFFLNCYGREDFVVPDMLIRDDKGRIVGCERLSKLG